MKKLFTFLLSVCVCSFVVAQSVRPEAVIAKAGTVKPVIDGVIDDLWATVEQHNVNLPFKLEKPTLGAEGTTYWKALWDDNGMYILIVVNDDVWFPWFGTTDGSYLYDKIELYFDTNYVLADAIGGQAGTTGNRQIAPDPTDGKLDGTMLTTAVQSGTVQYAYNVANPAYNVEYFVPWEAIPDKDGILFDKTATMGFDVDVTDNDNDGQSRKRMMWSNDGTRGVMDEDWNNMDEAGHLTFAGAEALVYVDVITLGGGNTITTNGGTLQLTAAITPADATNQKLKWTITNGTGKASISSTGLVSPILNGTVTVVAAALDGGWAQSDPLEITISNQVLDNNSIWNTLNVISNWSFEDGITSGFPTGWSGWVDTGQAGCAGQLPPAIVDGAVSMQCGLAGDGANYHYQLNESNLTCDPNVPYTLKFKSWASADATPCAVDFEDTSALNYNRYGAATDAEAVGGRSEWHYNVNSAPAWFTFHVTFDQIVPTTVQKIQWMNSLSNNIVYLDSVLLIKDSELAMVSTAKTLSTNSLRVYPNPVDNTNLLTVELGTMNAKVGIYNALGQKLIEKVANGYIAKFNVSSLEKGMYFVKLSDGTSQKFIK